MNFKMDFAREAVGALAARQRKRSRALGAELWAQSAMAL